MTFDFANYKKASLERPRDTVWGKPWGKFEQEGDRISGYIRDVFYKAAEGQYKEQRGFTLEQENGELINVTIKREPAFVLEKTNNLRLGDPLVIELTELKKAQTKGYSPAKILSFYGTNLPENAGNKTVKELELEDMKAGGSQPESESSNELDQIVDELTSTEEEPF